MPTIRPSSSPSNKYKDVLCVRLSSKFPTQAPRARGIAMVKPSWPINASDPQTEGGGFLFIRCFSSVFSRYYTMRIIAHWNIYLQQLIHMFARAGLAPPIPYYDTLNALRNRVRAGLALALANVQAVVQPPPWSCKL